ncbi:energy-coupling factor transporter ATP-binding protein EcfA2 [Mesorhizobium jarvisii]
MQYIRRTQIDFGKTDAKSALVTRDEASRRLFLEAFAPPQPADIDAIRNGDRFLFYGTKGSGKTALLRYVMELENQAGNVTRVIVFSEDISQQEKAKIAKPLNYETVSIPGLEEEPEVRDMWKLFLIQKISALLCEEPRLFDETAEARKINEIISKVFELNNLSTLQRILAGIKSGTLSLKGRAGGIAEIESTVNWERIEKGEEVDYSRFTQLVIEKICTITYPKDVKFILYLDEINLSMLGVKQHKKDSILIRDLIITVGNLNRVFVEKGVPIYVYAAVRVEIAKAVSISRQEIDKYLVDHGYKLQWYGRYSVDKYPINTIIENRIRALEHNIAGRSNSPEDIWRNYFSRDVYGVTPKRFISEITWCNPRDVVNLFNLTSRSEIHISTYNTSVFSSIIEEYSQIAWHERAEELNAEHNMAVVQVMKKCLNAWLKHFKVDQFSNHLTALAQGNSGVMQVKQTIGAERICRDLYYVGVLGQSVPAGTYTTQTGQVRRQVNETWFYRDNREFEASQWMIVHRALYPALKLSRLREDDFGNDPRFA